MIYILGLLAVTVVGGALLVRFTAIIMGRRAAKFLSETHGAIEYIHSTGAAPPQWLESIRKELQTLQKNDPQFQIEVERNARIARKTCLRKLAKLQKYIYRSSLVQDEGTRQILLEKFSNVREAWIQQDWKDVISS